MKEPIVFISRNRILEGMLDNFINLYHASIPVTEANKPGTDLQLAYFNEGSSEVIIVRFFADADALDEQLRGADERSKAVYKFIEPTGIEIYGTPGTFALEMMKKVAGSGILLSVLPNFTGGFIRSKVAWISTETRE